MTTTPATENTINAQQLWFSRAQQVEIREQALSNPGSDELLVKTLCSAISAGTEMLIYRGQIPTAMTLDASLDSLKGSLIYPLQYGYACVGEVQQLGQNVDPAWLGKLVFSFQPHASHFLTTTANAIPLPNDITPEAAIFLANMETAVNLAQDGNPVLGERVVVLGQGIVGLLVSSLLAQLPLTYLIALDGIPTRRTWAHQLGVTHVFDPAVEADVSALHQLLKQTDITGADLIYEVSGAPEALNMAIELSGFTSRIVIGSWYGNKTAPITLGGDAHRNRLKISTSQVSSLAPELAGRWNKARRFELAWAMIRTIQPERLISHRSPIADAANLYARLHHRPDDILQAIFIYP